MKKQLTPFKVSVLTHRKISGKSIDGSDAVYSKGVPVIVEVTALPSTSRSMLFRLTKLKRTDLMITKLLSVN